MITNAPLLYPTQKPLRNRGVSYMETKMAALWLRKAPWMSGISFKSRGIPFYSIDRFVLMVVHTSHVQASEMGSPTNKLVWKSREKHDLAGSRFWVELWKGLNYTCPVGFLEVTNQLNHCSSSGKEQGRHRCVRNVSPWQVPLHEKLKEQEMNFLLHLMMESFKVLI